MVVVEHPAATSLLARINALNTLIKHTMLLSCHHHNEHKNKKKTKVGFDYRLGMAVPDKWIEVMI